MRVAITIDAEHHDRPTTNPPGNARMLLDLLRDRGVPAAFFVQGRWALAYPHAVQRVVEEGHLLGCHSHWHCAFPNLTDEGIADDLARSRKQLESFAPTDRWFRLPGGVGIRDPRVHAAVGASGYEHVHWTCAGDDWNPNLTAEALVAPVLAQARSSEAGACVPLFHSWPDATTAVLEAVLDELQSSVQFVRLDELDPADVPRCAPHRRSPLGRLRARTRRTRL
jgi:peptidoglycan-N-acetylmuramic acid deacetylase